MSATAARRALSAALAKLPAGQRDALLLVAWGELTYEQVQYFENLFSSAPASQRPEKAFESIGQLLTLYVTQPAFTAELYRAIADIPGVTVNTHAVNLAGQPTIALSYLTPTKLLGGQIFLDPRSYQYVGAASTVKSGDHNYGLKGYTILRYALVSGPGVRP